MCQLDYHVVSFLLVENQLRVFTLLLLVAELGHRVEKVLVKHIFHLLVADRLVAPQVHGLVHLVHDLHYFLFGFLPELADVIEKSLTQLEVAAHVVLSIRYIVYKFLELQVPAQILNILFLLLLFEALVSECSHH